MESLSTAQPMNPAPGPTGMATVPPSNAGTLKKAVVLANLGMNLLLEAAKAAPDGSDEKVVLLEMLAKGQKKFAGVARDITAQEAKLITANADPAASASPEQALAASQAQARQRMQQMQPAMAGG